MFKSTIRKLLGLFYNTAPLTKDVVSGRNISIGDYTYGRPAMQRFSENEILSIGKYCSIAPKVTIILGGEHNAQWISTYPFPSFKKLWPQASKLTGHPLSKGAVTIGNDVWIGFGATIFSGVTIGDGAIIGALALVTKDVEPYTIAAGNPAKPIRRRFSDETITKLLRIKWWDWPKEFIEKHVDVLCSDNISQLIELSKQLSLRAVDD